MEGYTSKNPTEPTDKDGTEKRGSKKAKKESFNDVLNKSLESANKEEAAQKIADSSSMWERLTGKPEEPAEKADKETPAEAQKEEIATSKPEAVDEAIELPLDETTRDTAIEYIDLRGEAVSEAQASVEPESVEADELGANATLLVNAREQVQDAPEGSSLTEAIDTAYTEAVDAITTAAQAEAAKPDETVPDIAPNINPAIVAQAPEQEAAPSSSKPEATPSAENPNVPWYYNTDGSRKFYPGSWPPKPAKSPLEKITDDAHERNRRKDIERNIKKDSKEQTEAVQKYINTKEQAIRTEAAEIATAYKSAPSEKFMWTPAPKTVESAPQTARSELSTSQAAERGQRLERSELLAFSEKIIIDGTSLKTIYEAKQITEPGLRRITDEYLRGGDVKKALQHELLLKEMTYERDPQMRDRLAASYADVDAAAPRASSDSLASLHAQATEPPRTLGEQNLPLASGIQHNHLSPEQLLISVWAGVVIFLAIIATFLLFR